MGRDVGSIAAFFIITVSLARARVLLVLHIDVCLAQQTKRPSMTKVKIITSRIPSRPLNSVCDVSDEKAQSLVAQGFGEIVDEPKPKRGRPKKVKE